MNDDALSVGKSEADSFWDLNSKQDSDYWDDTKSEVSEATSLSALTHAFSALDGTEVDYFFILNWDFGLLIFI